MGVINKAVAIDEAPHQAVDQQALPVQDAYYHLDNTYATHCHDLG
jgi:hypothetical protein